MTVTDKNDVLAKKSLNRVKILIVFICVRTKYILMYSDH